MTRVLRERIENAYSVLVLEIPEELRGRPLEVEIWAAEDGDAAESQDREVPEWQIGDTVAFVPEIEVLGETWPEGLLEALNGSAPDLRLDWPDEDDEDPGL
jgi:hypothetical protein